MAQRRNWTLFAGIIAVAVMTIADSGVALHSVTALHAATADVMHSQTVLEALSQLMSTAEDAETGQRGFLITGDPAYLTPYYAAEGRLTERLHDTDSLTRGEPAQQALLPALRRSLAAKINELRETILLRQTDGFAAATRVVNTGQGKALMDTIRARIGDMVSEEQRELAERRVAAARSGNEATLALVLAGLLELATLTAVAWLLHRHWRSRERATRLLHDQKERLRVTLASIGDAVITTDVNGRITSLNPVAEQLTGWTVAEVTGVALETVFNIVNESTGLPVDNPALRALREGTITGLANHTVLIARDGARRPIDDSAAPIRSAAGELMGAVLVFRDITERYDAERRLRDSDHRKDEFLAVLAHELRNPLAPLRNALEVMRMSPNDATTVERVAGIMERQLQQMVHLIDDLLDVSRVTRNRLQLRRQPVDIAAVIHSALETCGPDLRDAGHTLKLTLPPQPIYVDADPTRLAQAVGNLLHNAIKYTDAGGRIWLSAARAGNEAVVVVRDSGIGLPPDMFDQVFEMFTQVDRSLERTRGGLGIGLPLVKHIVQMHDGSVQVTSGGAGAGSEFSIRLPVMLAAPMTERPPEILRRAAVPRRILVADDNADNADTLAMMLRVMGHDVCTAADGHEALQEAERFRPEVALLDIGMPRLNGYDTARAVRAADWGRDVVLVALTGWGQQGDRRRSKEAGFDHHLVKPVELAALEEVLK